MSLLLFDTGRGDGSIYDIVKLLLSIFVVFIHSGNMPDFVNPVLRVAVPLFFLMSSFFFWKKTYGISEQDKKFALIKFIKRNISLFLFWTILLLPSIDLSHYFTSGNIGFIQVARDFIFCDTFKGSWFIMSLIQSMLIIYLLTKFIANHIFFIISFCFYILCCCTSNYLDFFNDYYAFQWFNSIIHHGVGEASLSFFVSMIWVAIGKMFAENPNLMARVVSCPASKIYCIFLLFSFLLMLEYLFLFSQFGRVLTNDCYLFLLPVCALLFMIIYKNNTFSFRFHLVFRHSSTVIYCLHGFVLCAISNVIESATFRVILTLVICTMVALLFDHLSNYKSFHFLKISF